MSWSEAAYEAVAGLLELRTGLSFLASRRDSAELGIRRAMACARIKDPALYLRQIEASPDLLDDLIVELTVGETYFFREPGQFAFIRQQILPEIRRRRGPEHVVRAWSAGCASGEEAYSLAILFEQEGLGAQSHILATDISRAALASARAATYRTWSLRGEGALVARPYLREQAKAFVVDETIRKRVTIQSLNLALDVYPSLVNGTWAMDLILCRNVMIYFERQTVARVAQRLFQTLAAGGWLVAASSDPPLGDLAPFETIVTNNGIFYRRPAGSETLLPFFTDSATSAIDSVSSNKHGVSGAADYETWKAGSRSDANAPARAPDTPWMPDLEPAPAGSLVDQTAFLVQQPTPEATADDSPNTEKPLRAEQSPAEEEPDDVFARANLALARGDYPEAAALTSPRDADPAICALHVRALANLEPAYAEKACAEATARHPFSTELHYLSAVVLMELGEDGRAAQAARRALYLDRSLAVVHFALGSILRRQGDLAASRRAYRNARDLCVARPAVEIVPLADGEHAGRLAEAAAIELALLETKEAIV